MGYALLWVESLAVALLFVATVVAWLCRVRRRRPSRVWIDRWVRPVMAALAVLLPLAGYGVVIAGACLFRKHYTVSDTLIGALVVLSILFAVGGGWVIVAGMRRRGDDPPRAVAASWPRGKLPIALAVAVALHLTTFWNLDLGERQRLDGLWGEASALADSAAPPRVPDRDNAAFLYDQAFSTMGAPATRNTTWREAGFQWVDHQDPEHKFDPNSPTLRTFLENQASTLRLLREGAKRPACSFERGYSRPSFAMSFPEVDYVRDAVALLDADARCRAADGDLGAAMDDIASMFAMGEHIGAEPFAVTMLTAVYMNWLAMQTLQDILGSQRPTPADLARIDIPGHVSYHRLFQRVLRMEDALVLAVFADFGTGQPGFRNVIGFHDPGDRPFPWYKEMMLPLFRVFLLDDDLAILRRRMTQQDTFAMKPYHEAKGGWDELERTENGPGISIQNLAPAASRLAGAAARGDAQRGLARLALAACRYRAAQGRLPEKADELLPEYVAAVPRDPFDGKPLKWKRADGGSLVLYSIGPDMTDDGGKTFDEDGQTGDFTFELTP